MFPVNLLTLLPIEISVGIFRNFFNFDEKVKVLQDDYFWQFLSDPYAWREKPKVPLKTLKGASESFLNAVESGFYLRKDHSVVYKVINDVKRGVVTLEKFKHEIILPDGSCKQPKVTKNFLRTNDVKEFFSILKSEFKVLQHDDIFTDRLGWVVISIDAKVLENLKVNTLTHIHTNYFIYKKNQYFVFIEGRGVFSNIISFTKEDFHANTELACLILQICFTSCEKIIKTKNFIACKMIPWKRKFKSMKKTTFNYMSRKKLVKVTTKRK